MPANDYAALKAQLDKVVDFLQDCAELAGEDDILGEIGVDAANLLEELGVPQEPLEGPRRTYS